MNRRLLHRNIEAVSSFGERGLPYGLRVSLCTLQLACTGFGLLSSSCNTRYGWLVGPYPAGTLTLQENAKLTLALLTPHITGPRVRR